MNNIDALTKQALLSEVDIFRDLSAEEMLALGRAAPMKRVAAGTTFYAPDDPAEVLYILKEGRVKVQQLSPDGRALTMHIYEAGSIFGEMSLVGQRMYGAYAQALSACTLCLMSREHVTHLLFGDRRIALRIAEVLSERLTEVENRLIDFAYRRIPERLARLLLQLAQPHQGFWSRVQRLEVRYTHEELAEMAGTTRETTTKLLGEMRTLGFIALARGRITLLDLNGLQHLASGEPSGIGAVPAVPTGPRPPLP